MPGSRSLPDEPPPLHLSLLRRRDGGFSALATDLARVARLESIDAGGAAIDALRREAAVWRSAAARRAAGFTTADAAGRGACVFGRRLFETFLPGEVGLLLRETPSGMLRLQLDPTLAWVPWELAFDGEAFLGEKLRTARVVVDDARLPRAVAEARVGRPRDAARDGPALLIVTIDAASTAAVARDDRIVQLRALGGLRVEAVEAARCPRAGLAARIEASDIVHWIGPPPPAEGWACADGERLSARGLASLPSRPSLLIVESTVFGASPEPADGVAADTPARLAACGLNVLALGHPAGDDEARHAAEAAAAVVAALLAGTPAAEAVRGVRSLLHRRHGIAAVAALRLEYHGDGAAALVLPPAPVDNALRQVTILSIDLVDSTRLLSTLGAERYSDVLTDYHRRSAEILRRHDGVPDPFQGDDGAMCYFGVPVAREDAALQSLHAALAVVASMQELGLALRIGVCTGELVIRDGQPIGPAVHLAARLQSIARPGTIVVGESTRRIVRDRFRFEPIGPVGALKGFDAPQACFRLVGPAPPLPPAGAAALPPVPALAPFVGRQDELRGLGMHWAVVQRGALRLVRLTGEAGIGKSRLVREFTRGLITAGHEVFECRCAPEQVHAAFHPLVESIRAQLRIVPGDPPARVLDRLRALVARGVVVDPASLALLADLLGLPDGASGALDGLTPERRRQRTIDLLVELAEVRVRERAACLVVEDVHWIDASTAEYLARLAAAAVDRHLMIVLTTRPQDEAARWHPRAVVHDEELHGFSPETARALILATSGAHRLDAETVRSIAARADGVPLFIEESTRMAVEQGVANEPHGPHRPEAARAVPRPPTAVPGGVGGADPSVPTTILDLLTARLDALGAAKQLAQVGAAIGREFGLTLLQTVLEQAGSPIGAADALARLAALVRSGILLARRGEGGDTTFMFKHALLRDAAYRSLLERDRAQLHRAIAGALVGRFAELAERQPQLVAFHATAAGLTADALRHWEAAVRRAASRSAHAETIGYLGSALSVLGRTVPGVERDRLELRLQLMLAARLLATHGYGAERVERAYARAMTLAKALGDAAALLRVLLGFESWHFMRGDFGSARRYALEAAAGAGARPGVARVQTRWALANLAMHEGEMESSVRQMDDCRAEWEALDPRPDAVVQDPGVMCLCYSAWSLWQLGFPDEALRRVAGCVRQSAQRGHKFSLGVAHGFLAAIRQFRGEEREALASADAAIAVCEAEGFGVWLAHARLMRGRALAGLGEIEAGLDEMRDGYALWTASGAVVTTPFYLTQRAEGLALHGRPDEGLVLLAEALEIVERTGERYHEAEVRRLIGLLTWQSAEARGVDRRAEAAASMRQAAGAAAKRRLASLGLRAALGLFDLETAGGPIVGNDPAARAARARRRRATLRLADARDAIIGGVETGDLHAARMRLEAAGGRTSSSSAPAPLPSWPRSRRPDATPPPAVENSDREE